ncbi:hypothetical protein AAA799E16_01419 [Marine Group I thaumarchaeote SCGC AAA799-E16]|uniref:Uncharacterized protein n=2 Tax=Marine Group I TaxID=905826 RepID=A0A087RSV9_9ARCH|nr:hypothetical protein AAA799E16_01419 [Marine Group I thaumarchaeote SCGC AAA799-E16]KFM16563.1 hypothetical protein SCCGRSA3_02211 [Marine Group I thaumarchaeote SCGC RSA3]
MNIGRGLLIGILTGVLTSGAFALSYDFSQADAMAGMGGSSGSGGGMSHGSDSSGGMMGGGGPSRHGVFYGPGTVHQQCHKGGDMPPHYCEPYYKAMSSVVGVKVTNVDPVNEKTLRVTLKEISVAKPGVNQKISLSAGAGDLVGTAVVNGGWSGSTVVDVPLNGMGHIYNHGSMHVHIFPVTSG